MNIRHSLRYYIFRLVLLVSYCIALYIATRRGLAFMHRYPFYVWAVLVFSTSSATYNILQFLHFISARPHIEIREGHILIPSLSEEEIAFSDISSIEYRKSLIPWRRKSFVRIDFLNESFLMKADPLGSVSWDFVKIKGGSIIMSTKNLNIKKKDVLKVLREKILSTGEGAVGSL